MMSYQPGRVVVVGPHLLRGNLKDKQENSFLYTYTDTHTHTHTYTMDGTIEIKRDMKKSEYFTKFLFPTVQFMAPDMRPKL